MPTTTTNSTISLSTNAATISAKRLLRPNFEYYPSKALNNGMPIYSAFLHDALPSNLFPVLYPLPDGRIFMAANQKAMFCMSFIARTPCHI